MLQFPYFNTLLKRETQGDSDKFLDKNYERSRYTTKICKNIKTICFSHIWETFIVYLFLFYSMASYAADLGVHGTTYPIQEKDFIEYIKDKLTAMEESGELAKKHAEMQNKTKESARRPKPVEGITNTQEYREFNYDPTFILDRNITDSTGKILFVQGTKVNPLDTLPFSKTIIFINGDDEEQVQWALEKYKEIQPNVEGDEKVKIILTNGSPIDLMEKTQIRFYFDQAGYLVKKFGIQHVPTLVQQAPIKAGVKKTIVVKEIPMNKNSSENGK